MNKNKQLQDNIAGSNPPTSPNTNNHSHLPSAKIKICSTEFSESASNKSIMSGCCSQILNKDEGKEASIEEFERFLKFIFNTHFIEAQEFRLKGYNNKVPECESQLLVQLQEGLAQTELQICNKATIESRFETLELLNHLNRIKHLTTSLSVEEVRRWVMLSTPRPNSSKNPDKAVESSFTPEFLVRQLNSMLETLIKIVDTLKNIDNCNTPEKIEQYLIAETKTVFSDCDENVLMQAIDAVAPELWNSLIQHREAQWRNWQSETVDDLIKTTRKEAVRSSKLARKLRGGSQAFFVNVTEYFQSLDKFLLKFATSKNERVVSTNQPKNKVSHTRTNLVIRKKAQKFVASLENQKLQSKLIWSTALLQVPRAYFFVCPRNGAEQIANNSENSIIRTFFWQSQQSALKIQHDSFKLLSILKQLKKIRGVEVNPEKVQEKAINSKLLYQGMDIISQVRQWVLKSLEDENNQSQDGAKIATEYLLNAANEQVQFILAESAFTKEAIQEKLERQWQSIIKMVNDEQVQQDNSEASTELVKAIDSIIPEIAKGLANAARSLERAINTFNGPESNLSKSCTHLKQAQLKVTDVKTKLSAASLRMSRQNLDDLSRGSRLAKHWANLAKENFSVKDFSLDPQTVLRALKKFGLLDQVLSSGDPKGYLFATRLTQELDNARNDKLRLPMTPEQYSALQKGVVEYIEKWGQNCVSRGVSRLLVDLSFPLFSFNLSSSVIGIPIKVLKASLKTAYKVNELKKHIMPGQNKPYIAIHQLMMKQFEVLVFQLLMQQVPSLVKNTFGIPLSIAMMSYHSQSGNVMNPPKESSKSAEQPLSQRKTKLALLGDNVVDFSANLMSDGIAKGIKSGLQLGLSGSNSFPNSPSGIMPEPSPNTSAMHNLGNMKETFPLSANLAVNDLQEVQSKHAKSSSPLVGHKDAQHFHKRSKREIVYKEPGPSSSISAPVISDGEASENIFDFEFNFQSQTEKMKEETYLQAIKFALNKIENDQHFPEMIKNRAYRARFGDESIKYLVPVDISYRSFNNLFFLPETDGAISGVLINLDSEILYKYISKGEDLTQDIIYDLPFKPYLRRGETKMRFNPHKLASPSVMLRRLRASRSKLADGFNRNNPKTMDRQEISKVLLQNIEGDYKLKENKIANKRLVLRAIAGSHLPDPEVTISAIPYRLEFSTETLTSAEALRSFGKPFSSLSADIGMVASSVEKENIQEAESTIHKAEYIGSFVDVTVGAIVSSTPAGAMLNSFQAASNILADLSEGKEIDSLAVASLVLSSLPGEKIAVKLGKLAHISSGTVKNLLMISNKAMDLAVVGRGIKQAVETGEPLAIYQAFISSGMSIKDSYKAAKSLSKKLNFNKLLEESASIDELEGIELQPSAADVTADPTDPPEIRVFRIGSKEMRGRLQDGKIKIADIDSENWQEGNKLHLLAYRLQNAGGSLSLTNKKQKAIVIADNTYIPIKHNRAKVVQVLRKKNLFEQLEGNSIHERTKKLEFQEGLRNCNDANYDEYDNKSFEEQVEIFLADDTDIKIRGVLAGKMNPVIDRILKYDLAKRVMDWMKEAKRVAEAVDPIPQNLILHSQEGRCLPFVILMCRAIEKGEIDTLKNRFKILADSPRIVKDPWFDLVKDLHSQGYSSAFNEVGNSNVTLQSLVESESLLFPPGKTAVRVDLPNHTTSLSKVKINGKIKYIFYEPNYGLVYFDKYKDMCKFFLKDYLKHDMPDNAVKFIPLNFSKVSEVKIKGHDLDQLINFNEVTATPAGSSRSTRHLYEGHSSYIAIFESQLMRSHG